MLLSEYQELLLMKSFRGEFPSVQGKRCRYLCDDGRRCVIGLILPKELCHTLDIEYGTLDSFWHLIEPHVPEGMTRTVARRLQQLHDRFAAKKFWHHYKFERLVRELFATLKPR